MARILLYTPALVVIVLFAFVFSNTAEAKRRHREVQTGLASFYDEDFDGERTASGKRFDPDHLVAAHPHYPVGTVLRVTNLENGRSVKVRIIDRGPSRENRAEGVIVDLSRRAAEKLGFTKAGRTRVRTKVLKWGQAKPDGKNRLSSRKRDVPWPGPPASRRLPA